jgi:hypothetical protein
MARRHADKARSAAAPARDPDSRGRTGSRGRTVPEPVLDSRLRERLAAAERERDALREEVATLQARCRALEDCNAHVRNRIGWAIDSLRDLIGAR